MAGRRQNKAIANGGRLAYSCDDLSDPFPHGGVGLGLIANVYFLPPGGYYRLPRGESNHTESVVYTGGDAFLGFKILSWDEDAADGVLDAIHPTASESSGKEVLTWSSGDAGKEAPTLSPLVFSPNDPSEPALILYNASVEIEATQQVLSSMRFHGLPVLCVGKPDSGGRVAARGPLSELLL